VSYSCLAHPFCCCSQHYFVTEYKLTPGICYRVLSLSLSLSLYIYMCVCVCVCVSHNSSGNRARNFDSSTKYNTSVYLIGAYPLYIIPHSTMHAGLEERQLSIEHSIAQPDGSTPTDEISGWVTQG